jgi:class 3 adenylate cyclase
MRPRQERVLVAVLFTDIVGSSALLAELGDRRWRELLARHHAIVRGLLRNHDGREVDTAGDGFFAVFRNQEQAIRCACAITVAVLELGIEVRAGLTAGQVERSGRAYGGLAVHTGARIMAAAGAGQVLVSGVLRDLVGGSGIEFSDLGDQSLKGIPDTVHLYAVRAVDSVERPGLLDADEAARRRADIEPPPVMRRHPRLIVSGIALAVIALITVVVAASVGGSSVRVRPGTLLELNANGQPVADIAVSDPTGTAPLAVPAGRQIWTFSYVNRTVTCVSVAHAAVHLPPKVDSRLGGSTLNDIFGSGMAYSQGFGWVANSVNAVAQIDPANCTTLGVHPVPGGAALMANVRGVPWVVAHDSGRIYACDDTTQTFTPRFHPHPILQDVRSMTYGDNAVWITDYGNNSVKKVDPTTGRTTQILLPPQAAGPSGITMAFGYLWTANLGSGNGANSEETVARINPATLQVSHPIRIGGPTTENSSDIVESPDHRTLWVTSPGTNSIVQIDPTPQPHVVNRIQLAYVPRNLTAAYGHLWVVVGSF